jgi:hypothetical protein
MSLHVLKNIIYNGRPLSRELSHRFRAAVRINAILYDLKKQDAEENIKNYLDIMCNDVTSIKEFLEAKIEHDTLEIERISNNYNKFEKFYDGVVFKSS